MKRILVALLLVGLVGCTHLNSEGNLERHAGGRAFWSFLLPGVGQVMNEEGGKAVLLLSLELANLATYYQEDEGERNDERLFSVMGALRLWSVTDAYDVATKLNETKPFGVRFVPQAAFLDTEPEPDPTPLVFVLDPVGGSASAVFCHRF